MNRSLASLPLLALVAACGGGGPQTISGQGPVVAPGGTDPHTFVAPTVTKSYNSPAALQSLSYDLIDVYHYDKKDDPNSTTVPPTRIRDDTILEVAHHCDDDRSSGSATGFARKPKGNTHE